VEVKKKRNKEESSSTWNIKPYLAMGLTSLMVIMVGTVFFFFVYRYKGASQLAKLVVQVLQPIVFGIGIAYILNPMFNRYQTLLETKAKLKKNLKKYK